MYRLLVCVAAAVSAPPAAAQPPGQEQRVRDLLRALRTETGEEQKKAAHGLWHAIYYDRIGSLAAKDVVAELAAFATHDSDYVREYVVGAIAAVRDPVAVPVLIKALDDRVLIVRGNAAEGLARLGPKAKDAIPLLTAKIRDRSFLAFQTLAAVAGKDSVPVILEAVENGKLNESQQYGAASALAEFPDPRAAAFMGTQLDRGSVSAAMFFAKLADGPSLARLRKCLGSAPAAGPAADIRWVAVEALGRAKDKDSFDALLRMVGDDPSVRVRTAAAVAMGEYADGRAVPALAKALGAKDEGFGAEGHTDGDLRRAAVRALGRVGSDDALTVLYAGAAGGPARSQCLEFWFGSKDPKHLGAYLKRYDADPHPPDVAAGVIHGLLRSHTDPKLAAKEQAAAEEEFFKNVDDPDRLGPKADLSGGGKWRVGVAYTFRAEGFVTVAYNFRDINPNGFGHGYSVLYRKVGGRWKPLGKTSGWVE